MMAVSSQKDSKKTKKEKPSKPSGRDLGREFLAKNPKWAFAERYIHKDTTGIDTSKIDKGYVVLRRSGHDDRVISIHTGGEVYRSGNTGKIDSWLTNQIKADALEKKTSETISGQEQSLEEQKKKETKRYEDLLAKIEAEKIATAKALAELNSGKPLSEILADLKKEGLDDIAIADLQMKLAPYERAKKTAGVVDQGIDTNKSIMDALEQKRDAQEKNEEVNRLWLTGEDSPVKTLADMFKTAKGAAETVYGIGKGTYNAGKTIAGGVKDAYLTVGDLFRGKALGSLEKAEAETTPFLGEVFDDVKKMRGKRKSLEDVTKDFWANPNLRRYDNLQGHRNKMSNIAASGHYAGSTAFEDAERDYGHAMNLQDMEIIDKMYNMAEKDWMGQGNYNQYLSKAATQYGKDVVQPSLDQHNLWSKSETDTLNNQIGKNRDNMNFTEGKIKINQMDTQARMGQEDRLAGLEGQALGDSRSLSQGIQELQQLLNNKDILNGQQMLQLQQVEMQMWSNREAIIQQLIQNGYQNAASELAVARTPQDFSSKLAKYAPMASTALGAIAGGVAGGPAGAMKGAEMGASIPWGNIFGGGR